MNHNSQIFLPDFIRFPSCNAVPRILPLYSFPLTQSPYSYASCMMATLNARLMLPGRQFRGQDNSSAGALSRRISFRTMSRKSSALSYNGVHVMVTTKTDLEGPSMTVQHDVSLAYALYYEGHMLIFCSGMMKTTVLGLSGSCL